MLVKFVCGSLEKEPSAVVLECVMTKTNFARVNVMFYGTPNKNYPIILSEICNGEVQ